MKEIVRVIVAIIENPEGKMLLLHRSPDKKWAPGLWNIVSGKIEKEDKTPLHAALREIREEVAMPVVLQKEHPVYDVDYDGKIWRTFAFRFQTEHTEPSLNDEHVAFQWIEPAELSRFEIVPIVLEDLRQMGYIS